MVFKGIYNFKGIYKLEIYLEMGEERCSFREIISYLGQYETYGLGPKSLNSQVTGIV